MIKKLKLSAFTLLEVMVVLVVIGLTVGIIGISTNSLQARNELQPLVDNLFQKLTNLEPQAILKQTEIGLSFYNNKIEVLEFDSQRVAWQYRKTISIPANVTVKYEITEKNLFVNKLLQAGDLDPSTVNNFPDIIFTANGRVTPFKLFITHPNENNYYVITSQFSGELTVEPKPTEQSIQSQERV